MSLRERHWKLWVMQTARHYGDIVSVIQKTGIENIDNEHRTMVGLVLEINHLIDSLDQSNFSLDLVYQVGELCNRLRDTTHSPFLNEENLFNQYQIAGMEVHAHKHHLILDQLDEMIEDLSGGRLNITLTLKEAILEWVVIHINEEDAATFGPQNMARTILNHPESSELYSIFSNTGIPSLDQIYLQLHKEAVVFDTSHEHIHHLQKILELSQKIEKNILTRYKINISENYPIENQQLTVKLENILSFKNEQRQVEFQHWFSDWWSYHFNVHISQFEVSNWMFKAISKSQQPKDLEAIFPLLSIEELDQGRMYT